MKRNKLVIIETFLIVGIIILACCEIYLGWNLLKTEIYELEINDSNRDFISTYIEDIDEIKNIKYQIPLHDDVYEITYSNGLKKEIVNNDWSDLKEYIKINGENKSAIYYLLFPAVMIVIIILIILKVIIGNKLNKLQKIYDPHK